MDPQQDIIRHYEERYDEHDRLLKDGIGMMEFARTRVLLDRYLPDPPASILDVGGGPGIYSEVLSAAGYDVELIDIVPRHIREATAKGIRAQLGDARSLAASQSSQDAVLLLGPLYHLTEREDRIAVLKEAARVGKIGAPVFGAAISRYAPAIDGLDSGYWDDAEFVDLATKTLRDGKHFNPTGNPAYFTTAFFHRPGDLLDELEEAGLADVEVLAVEGISWAAADLDEHIADDAKRERLLGLIERLESEGPILGASPHLLGVGRVAA